MPGQWAGQGPAANFKSRRAASPGGPGSNSDPIMIMMVGRHGQGLPVASGCQWLVASGSHGARPAACAAARRL
jgi:hypothetical protein